MRRRSAKLMAGGGKGSMKKWRGSKTAASLVTIEIVGEFEQRANEDAVGFSAFRHPGIAIGGRRQAFGHEAAFGADRHDDGVLDLLCLDQAEDLGAEILRPVGPAQAAARHLAEAQMNAFATGRIDEKLVN